MSRPVTERQLRYQEYVQREAGIRHQNTEEDLRPFEFLKVGDLRSVEAMQEMIDANLAGTTSKDPLRNAKYLFVAITTLAGRAAMSVGMDTERSNTASDLFIQAVDEMTSIDQINEMTLEMIRFYTMEVAALDKANIYSRNVVRAFDYIYNHLHEPITAQDVADHVGVSRTYFSTLFKKETGIGIAAYIKKKRMEAACNMLLYSDIPYAEISQILAFSSQSHFTQVFKEYTGMTPHEYRKSAPID